MAGVGVCQPVFIQGAEWSQEVEGGRGAAPTQGVGRLWVERPEESVHCVCPDELRGGFSSWRDPGEVMGV